MLTQGEEVAEGTGRGAEELVAAALDRRQERQPPGRSTRVVAGEALAQSHLAARAALADRVSWAFVTSSRPQTKLQSSTPLASGLLHQARRRCSIWLSLVEAAVDMMLVAVAGVEAILLVLDFQLLAELPTQSQSALAERQVLPGRLEATEEILRSAV